MSRNLRNVIVCLLLVVVVIVAWFALYRPQRPMFHNIYARGDRDLFRRWIWQPPATDRQGNYALADFELNLLVIVLSRDSEGVSIYPFKIVDEDRAVLRFSTNRPDDLLVVPRTENEAIVFLLDLTRRATAIKPGAAQTLFRAIGRSDSRESLLLTILEVSDDPNVRLFVEKLLSELDETATTKPASQGTTGNKARPNHDLSR